MQKLKIDVKKIDKSALYEGAKGTYLDLTLMENRQGPDQYGNDGFIIQEIGQTRREAGEKGPIIGNWKHAGQKAQPGRERTAGDAYTKTATPPPVVKPGGYNPDPDDDQDSIPF